MTIPEYIVRVFRQFDIFVNAVICGREYETISARAGRALLKGRPVACVLCRFLDLFEHDHCLKSLERNNRRLHCEVDVGLL